MPTTGGVIVVIVEFDAMVLAGGAASRLGGIDKAALQIDGRTLLQHTLDALAGARRIVVVGGEDPEMDPRTSAVSWVVEHPPGGGPAAAIAAGVEALAAGEHAEVVAVLACDMPAIGTAVPLLLEALDGAPDVDAVLAQVGDRTQYLAGVHRTAALHHAVQAAGDLSGGSVRGLWSALRTMTVQVPPGSTADIDTWDDARRAGVES